MHRARRISTLQILSNFPRPLLFAHRGYSSQAPENTLAAFSLAAKKGIPGVELDVQQTADGFLVVYHDFTLDRLNEANIEVSKVTFSELSCIDAGAWFDSQFKGEKIPLLHEVFQLLGDRVYYDIEIKTRSRNVDAFVKNLIETIESHNLERQCLISSFNPFPLKLFKRSAPHIPTAIIYTNHDALPVLLRNGQGRFISHCDILKPHYSKTTWLSLLSRHRILGYPIIPWTVNNREDGEKLVSKGCEGLISDDPDLFMGLSILR